MSNAKNMISEHSEKHFDYSQTAVCDSAHKKLNPDLAAILLRSTPKF